MGACDVGHADRDQPSQNGCEQNVLADGPCQFSMARRLRAELPAPLSGHVPGLCPGTCQAQIAHIVSFSAGIPSSPRAPLAPPRCILGALCLRHVECYVNG